MLEEVQRYNEEDCRSTFALHGGSGDRPPGPVAAPSASAATRRRRSATRSAAPSRRAARAEGGPAAGCSRTSSTTTSARPARVVGWFRWPRWMPRSSSADAEALGGLEPGPPGARGRWPEPSTTASLPAAGAQARRGGLEPGRRSPRVPHRRRRRQGRRQAVPQRQGGDEPVPRALTPGPPIPNWIIREALLRFVRAYATVTGRRTRR